MESIVLASGCFWCGEAVFQRLKGVLEVVSGYTGGTTDSPTYQQVTTGATNHAEATKITFNPKQISLEQILEVFWAMHNPTTLNRQGADVGTQYRSAIFYNNETQHQIAEQSVKEAQKYLKDKIVTEIRPLDQFFPAESYHQNYYNDNKNLNPYCSIVIEPKIQKLLEKFNSQIKDEYKK